MQEPPPRGGFGAKMSDTVIHQDPELTRAADAFVANREEESCYGVVNGVCVFVSRDLRQAFECGVAWADKIRSEASAMEK
jgi:hypothetical protein